MSVNVAIHTEHIPLASLLKLAGVVNTGGHAKVMVQGGEVSLNGEVTTQRRRKIRPGDVVEVAGDPPCVIHVTASAD